ncbi:MAG TPA: hypothetical protein VIT67_13210 [Povalibacter sp.]
MNSSLAKALVLFLVGALVATAAVIAARHSPAEANQPMLVRSYDVKSEIASEMRDALNAAINFGNDKDPVGRATLSPNGRLLITAPESVQQDVASIIADVEGHELAPTPLINCEVWLVSSHPGTIATSEGAPAEIGPALEEIAKSQGSARFELLEKLSTRVRSGQGSKLRGSRSSLQVTPSVRRGHDSEPVIALDMTIETRSGALQTEAELHPGQIFVLGQSGFPDASPGGEKSQLYYIVRASL